MRTHRLHKLALTSIGPACFPTPEGTAASQVANPSFEAPAPARPPGWGISGGTQLVRNAADAPDGAAYLRIPVRERAHAHSDWIQARGNRPALMSLWVRANAAGFCYVNTDAVKRDRNMNCIGNVFRSLPHTGGKWRRVGFYFRMPPLATAARLMIHIRQTVEGGAIDIDDLRLRTATEDELAAAYEGWRKEHPPHDITPRPTDGRNLALAIHKLQGHGIPGKPFLIWAIGASWTNFLGDGDTLIHELRKRFPNAPEIIYKKHAGSGTPYDFARGWAHQFVIPDQPDLVLSYTHGSPEALDRMLDDIRRHTTADVVIPSRHLLEREKPADLDGEPWPQVRDACRKHGAEFVETRRELLRFLKSLGKPHTAILGDPVHQNELGRLLINETIVRHFAPRKTYAYSPESRERRIVPDPATLRSKGQRIAVSFTGNRIDLVGFRSTRGGTAQVVIDGQPADQAPVFFTNFIRPGRKNAAPNPPPPTDCGPHAVFLGRNLVPQTWTIEMTSDTGDYLLRGSVTGPDGAGSNEKPFTSTSGQIRIFPNDWRHARDKHGHFVNRKGDTWTFDVVRCAAGRVSFRGKSREPERFHTPLVQNLPNGKHTLELIANGTGQIAVDFFHIFEPPAR